MKLNSLLAAAFLLAFTASPAWALEIRNGSIEFTYDRIFYNNLPETLVSALIHPRVRSSSKKKMILRMAQDPNLPAVQYKVLFEPQIHRDREVTLAVMYALQNHHPEHMSRLSKFPFTIEAALEMLSVSNGERFEFQTPQNQCTCVEIYNVFLDQALTWFEALIEADAKRLAAYQNFRLFLETGGKLAGTHEVFRFGSRYEKDEKAAAYEMLLLHLRAARLALKFGFLQTAKRIEGHILLSLPSEVYSEKAEFTEELEQVRAEVKQLAQQIVGTPLPTASYAPKAPAPVSVEQTAQPLPSPEVTWTVVDDRPAEKALLDAAAARDGFAMSLAVRAWPEGVRLSKKALVKLSNFMTAPIEITGALRSELEALVLPQLEVRRSELAYEVKLSDRNQALFDACNTHLLPKLP